MDFTEGSTIVFSVRRKPWNWPVFRAVAGRNPSCSYKAVTKYIYMPSERIALAIHGVERLGSDERRAEQTSNPDMPDAVFIDGLTAKRINARRQGNHDCKFKGCHDRYHCIWFNPESERDAKGNVSPWNKVPETHKVGSECCPRFFSPSDIKVWKRKKPKPKPRKKITLYSLE